MRNTRAFTLIEIIVAVALVAILSAAIAPSVLNNIAQGRNTRAMSDVQAIASAIMMFKNDTGFFPRYTQPSGSATDKVKTFNFLVSRNGTWPPNKDGNTWWPTTYTDGVEGIASCEDFTSHLMNGSSRYSGPDSAYDRASDPSDPTAVGFRSGLISSDPADPWGNKYFCNIAQLGQIGRAVWIISAGPNKILDTEVKQGTGAVDSLGLDDIGYRIQ